MDELITKMVQAENDSLRGATGQTAGTVPTYTPVAFSATGQVD